MRRPARATHAAPRRAFGQRVLPVTLLRRRHCPVSGKKWPRVQAMIEKDNERMRKTVCELQDQVDELYTKIDELEEKNHRHEEQQCQAEHDRDFYASAYKRWKFKAGRAKELMQEAMERAKRAEAQAEAAREWARKLDDDIRFAITFVPVTSPGSPGTPTEVDEDEPCGVCSHCVEEERRLALTVV